MVTVEILGLPDWLFTMFAALGITITMLTLMLVLWFLTPKSARKLLKAKLKHLGMLAVYGKASLRFIPIKTIAPGWVETEEGKKFIWPIPPKEKSETWSAERDVLGKVEYLDGIPTLAVYEAEALAVNSETLATLEAYSKGYDSNVLPFPDSPGKIKVYVPVNPKLLTETLRSMVTTEHIDVFEQYIVEREAVRKGGEWAPIIKIGIIIGAIAIVAIIAMLLAKGAIFGG